MATAFPGPRRLLLGAAVVAQVGWPVILDAIGACSPNSRGFGCSSTGIELRPYIRADETIEPRPRSPATYDPDAVGRGSRSHARVQNALSDHLSAANITPGRPEHGDPPFDLGWKIDSTFYIAEVKSLTRDNEEKQLRLGLGQVLRYRHQLRGRMLTIIAVLAVERPPTDRSWVELCDELGVRLVWPDGWEGLSREQDGPR